MIKIKNSLFARKILIASTGLVNTYQYRTQKSLANINIKIYNKTEVTYPYSPV